MKSGFVYIVTNKNNTTYYTGVTSSLVKRVYDHKLDIGSVFTKKYKLNKLVYYEVCNSMLEAIVREKQIKDMNRNKKIKMIHNLNPNFVDLFDEIKKLSL
ncbi:excinuclease ABC subunit C [Candidatus Roizmanbacteria bacterium RIFCSPHIGHO2_02_FULL_37_13b]|uniref:Excinuclease ABC subunit C n=1 Tax=Candidatus Roizmanbacteria bacterium RIFCSPLOWO2_02_FULL_36_11 TaxID=1802071 RepID=A0A1F7JH53_9BACT|nr:MAG: excinuclease ABC subunit C [Candidatus Roizmanbacteria bacterium RIFCSPHIGHO2_02_FULL_37_13b]OGK54938.1 MAG: excinuclease ABC subunit C [Candidatus Roizmanbacteria bacterium RIFCSPLOWO2_02_FULL_36_11]